MIALKPIRETKEEYDAIEKRIRELFKRAIYIPLLREFSDKRKLQNSRDDLLEALRTGRITFHRGKFTGKLNATLSKELRSLGATWDRKSKSYTIERSELPTEVQSAISSSATMFQRKIDQIDKKLADIVPEELAAQLKVSKLFDQTLWKVEKEFQKSVKNITVAPQFTADQAKRIADEWQNNMEKFIVDFTKEEVQKLRSDMQKSVFAGNRYESAIQSIQDSYGVTYRKAKFLARQETALLMAKHKEVKYQAAGINEYKWKSVTGTAAHPVRPRHKELNDASDKGKLFRFDDPPVTTAPGEPERRNNPGEDYNCRCTAIPIVRK